MILELHDCVSLLAWIFYANRNATQQCNSGGKLAENECYGIENNKKKGRSCKSLRCLSI